MIWKSPWGQHIDISKIVCVELILNRIAYCEPTAIAIKIHIQLLEKPITVVRDSYNIAFDVIYNSDVSEDHLFRLWMTELLEVWKANKE